MTFNKIKYTYEPKSQCIYSFYRPNDQIMYSYSFLIFLPKIAESGNVYLYGLWKIGTTIHSS